MPKLSVQGCAHAANDPLVEDMLELKKRLRDSSHLAFNFAQAISSIRAHTVPLRSASEAKKLRHIGNYLANQILSILRKRGLLEEQNCGQSFALPNTAPVGTQSELSIRDNLAEIPDRLSRVYAPAYRKQPWFVLLALQEAQAIHEDAAIPFDVLFKRMLNAGYEGTSVKLRTCLASLTGTHEVIKRSGLGFYYLTERGRRSAELCPGSMMEAVTTADTGTIPRNNSTSTKSNTVCNTDTTLTEEVRQRPSDLSWTDVTPIDGESLSELTACPIGQAETLNTPFLEELIRQTDIWELVIVLDHREIIERRNPRILERKLQERNINCEVRALGVGDVQYIARRRRIGGETQEFMLNVIVERKEVHDLSGSIIDRRFYEQKTRLATVRKNCGNVHVIYLIEGSLTQITTVRTSGLNTAMARTQMQNNFFVQQSQNSDETVAFLARVYSRLLSRFPPTLEVMRPVTSQLLPSNHFDTNDFAKIFCLPPQTFAPFNSQFGKKTQFSVREIYQRMLLQVPGFSAAKTIELTAKYQNLKELETALRKRDRDSEVEHVRYGKCQRRLGTRVRTTLSHIFTSNEYTEDI